MTRSLGYQLHSLPYPRLLVTIPSHCLNLPPQNPTCKSMPQLHSLPYPRLLVTIPSHFLNLPPSKPYMQEYLFLNFTASPLPDFLLDSKSFPKPPPQNHTCKSMPQLHRLPPSRVLVTIPSHFFNFPPPKLYMQEYASTSKPPLSTTSCVRIQVIF